MIVLPPDKPVMPDCDYCGESFADEDAYLDHLGAEHYAELGSIDKRRVDDHAKADDDGLSVGVIAGVVVGVAILAAGGYLLFAGGGESTAKGEPAGFETDPLPNRGDDSRLQDVQSFESQGNQHVDSGTEINYERIPPTSGPHYPVPARAGFYEETPALGNLVHSLEHGAVVIYYDPSALTPHAEASLKAYAQTHTDGWKSVIVAPNPREDPESPFVLTAWTKLLRMDEYDAKTVRAFLAEYLGRGPENPVR